MKFGQPLISTQLSGALGGIVGATSRGGVGYFRRRVDPSNPNSVEQAVTRAIVASISNAWVSTLNGSQRQAWENLAAGSSSGIDALVKGNFQLLRAGEALEPDAPVSLALDANPVVDTPVVDVGDADITLNDEGNTNVQYNIYASTPQSATRFARQFGYRFVGTATPDAGVVTLSFSGLDHPISSITAGQVVYLRLSIFGIGANTGRVNVPQVFRVTAVA